MKEETALRLAVCAGRHKRSAYMTGFSVLRNRPSYHAAIP
jgi:hypothetical protein